MPDFTHRADSLEQMDAPGLAGDTLRLALAELALINSNLDGYQPSIAGIAALLEPNQTTLSVLDVGVGGGDFLLELFEWARARRIDVRITGIDLQPAIVAYAREQCRERDAITIVEQDLFTMDDRVRFDVVHAGLVLHHFPGASAVEALRHMARHARLGIVVNDLHRHPIAYHAIRVLTWLFAQSPMIKNDAPLSVLRGFSHDELVDLAALAGLPAPSLAWRWAFRWQMVVRT